MDEAKLTRVILSLMENDSLNNRIFKKAFQKKICTKYKSLSKNQPHVIKILGMKGEMMPSTIGEYLWMDKSSLTHIIDNLEKKEIVYRKKNSEDRRKLHVSLTNKGLVYYNHLSKMTGEMADEVLEHVDGEDLDDFIHSLETMIKIFTKIETAQIFNYKLNKCLMNHQYLKRERNAQ